MRADVDGARLRALPVRAADHELARALHERGMGLPQIQRTIWLGCLRKHGPMLGKGVASPVASLAYFGG